MSELPEREPIVDALLEELLGGEQPPDLTQRILGAHDASTESHVDVGMGKRSSSNGAKKSASEPAPLINPKVTTRRPKAASPVNWSFWVSAAVVLVAASGFAYWAITTQNELNIANRPPEQTTEHPSTPEPVLPDDFDSRVADIEAERRRNAEVAPEVTQPIEQPKPVQIAKTQRQQRGIQTESPKFERTLEIGSPQSDGRIVKAINRELTDSWKAKSITQTGAVNDEVWFQRASQFLVGRKPTANERNAFERDRDREEAIDSLLASSDFADHWSKVLVSTLVDSGGKRGVNRVALESWLADSLGQDKAYDQIAFELLTAVGSNHSEAEDFNPATNFLIAHRRVAGNDRGQKLQSQKVAATDKVCQVFLGKQMQCAQCHDHPAKTVTQEQYYEVASFFTQMRSQIADQEKGTGRLVNVDYRGSDGNVAEADLFFSKANGEGVSVYPKFLEGTTLATTSGKVDVIDRRAELAKSIVSSEDFAAATMNRFWDQAFGSGFTTPVDDMGPHNPPTHPKLLAKLSTEFQNHRFNVKSALTWITMSSAFDRRERAPSDALAGRNDLFSSFSRQDGQTYESVGWPLEQLAKRSRNAGGGLGNGAKEVYAQLGASKKISPERRAREEHRINGMLNEKLLRTGDGSLISKLASNERMRDGQRLYHLFYSTVGRPPAGYERTKGLEILKPCKSVASRMDAMKQIGWVLLNSEEYRSQH